MLYILLAAVVVAADQLVKHWTAAHLALGESAPLLPGFAELLRVHNYGAAWSSFSGMRWVLAALSAAIVVGVTVLCVKKIVRHPLGRTACALIAAGGLGNLIDRVRLGYVVDMFHFQFWPSYPVFNVADMGVVCGVVLAILYYLWFYDRFDRRRP